MMGPRTVRPARTRAEASEPALSALPVSTTAPDAKASSRTVRVQNRREWRLWLSPGRSTVTTMRMKNSASRGADQRIPRPMMKLIAAASSAAPKKYVQNSGQGIQRGTIGMRSRAAKKCSAANMVRATASKTGPSTMRRPAPVAARKRVWTRTNPAMSAATPAIVIPQASKAMLSLLWLRSRRKRARIVSRPVRNLNPTGL